MRRIVRVVVICVCVMTLCVTALKNPCEIVQIDEEPIALQDSVGILIRECEADIRVIPDKYNTGVKGKLVRAELGDKIQGIQFVAGNNGTVNALDFPLRNPKVFGTVVFENVDFSDYPMWTYRETTIENNIKVIFNNCKFSQVTTGKVDANISYEFNDCTLTSFKGSNATFNRCSFGKSYSDGLVPFRNVIVKDCFISDMASIDEAGKGLHTDGTQIYGYKEVDVENVHFDNCRFEVPAIQTGSAYASINACIMLQMEYSDAKNMSFTNCIVNGGSYSVYANDKHKGHSFTNVSFENIMSGCAKMYGTIYPFISEGINIKNIVNTQSLYVGSVWKEENITHISVTNDTNQDRKLLVYADGKEYQYEIPACPDGDKLYSSYDLYPFDIDIQIPEACSYVVCYDISGNCDAEQIRFINWSGRNVYINTDVINKYVSKKQTVETLLEGKCGENVDFILSSDGTLTLYGSGKTDSYNSKKSTPWSDYKMDIASVEVKDGITNLGAQIFKGCSNLNHVVLPEGLTNISLRAFDSCYGLANITLPQSISTIGDYAFWGAVIQNTYYNGTEGEWDKVSVGANNDMLLRNIVCNQREDDNISKTMPIIIGGQCGATANFKLTSDGILTISGVGEMDNYNSIKTAPWFDERERISKVVIEDGITTIGSQAFRQCKNITEVAMPNTLTKIGGNSFIQCIGIQNIELPTNVREIQRYAFAGTKIRKCEYAGTEDMWNKVVIGEKNEVLFRNLILSIR